MVINVIQKIRGNENSPDSLNVIVNHRYHGENRIITRLFPTMIAPILSPKKCCRNYVEADTNGQNIPN